MSIVMSFDEFRCFNKGMCRLFKIKLVKMCEKWSHFLLLLLCLVGIILFAVFRVAPQGVSSVLNFKQVLLGDKHQSKTIGPREKDQKIRKELIDKVCGGTRSGSVGSVVLDSSVGLSYCVLPNAGSKFWLQTFKSLQNEDGDYSVMSPVDLNEAIAHNSLREYFKLYHPQSENDQLAVDSTTKMIFVRNPYARLWHAYIENVYLPVTWSTIGKEIAMKRKHPTRKSEKCGHDATFEEFLDYVISDSRQPEKMNNVWKPVFYACSPCLLQPDFVGKMESFDIEAKYMLRKFNLLDQLDKFQSFKSEIEEITIMINSYFRIFREREVSDCISMKGLAERIWTGLQVGGYLPLRTEKFLELYTDRNFDVNIFREHLIHIYGQGQETKRMWEKQKNKLLTHAYKEIPFRILKNLTQIFAFDFKAFNYEMFPKAFLKTIG